MAKGGRPKAPRGRDSAWLNPVRVSAKEKQWVLEQMAARGHSQQRFVRDRVFAAMPGYKPEG